MGSVLFLLFSNIIKIRTRRHLYIIVNHLTIQKVQHADVLIALPWQCCSGTKTNQLEGQDSDITMDTKFRCGSAWGVHSIRLTGPRKDQTEEVDHMKDIQGIRAAGRNMGASVREWTKSKTLEGQSRWSGKNYLNQGVCYQHNISKTSKMPSSCTYFI